MLVCFAIFVAMYIETVANRNSPPCILLRESFRQEGKVKHRTLANPNLEGAPAWQQETEPSALQQRAFDLLKNIPTP